MHIFKVCWHQENCDRRSMNHYGDSLQMGVEEQEQKHLPSQFKSPPHTPTVIHFRTLKPPFPKPCRRLSDPLSVFERDAYAKLTPGVSSWCSFLPLCRAHHGLHGDWSKVRTDARWMSMLSCTDFPYRANPLHLGILWSTMLLSSGNTPAFNLMVAKSSNLRSVVVKSPQRLLPSSKGPWGILSKVIKGTMLGSQIKGKKDIQTPLWEAII